MNINNQKFIADAVRNTRAFWNAYEDLKAMQDQWNALDYGSTLQNGEGSNANVLAADVGAVIFGTMNAVESLLNTGHATNLAKLL